MNHAITIAELLDRGTAPTAAEAVAIIQALIEEKPSLEAELHEPFGPPRASNIELRADGSVACTGCASTPAVSELGILLQEILRDTARIPGGLRYAIGRALLDVDAPPFDSIEDFSRSLARFETGDRREVIRQLRDRVGGRLLPMPSPRTVSVRPPTSTLAAKAPVDRRQHGPRSDQLRRELREADRRLYARERSIESQPLPAVTSTASSPARSTWPAATAVAALVLIAIVLGTTTRPPRATADHSASPIASSAPRRASKALSRPAGQARSPETASSDASARAPQVPPADRIEPQARPVAPGASVTNVAERHPRVDSAEQNDGWLVPSLDVNQRPVFSPSFASNGSAVFYHTGMSGDSRSALMSADTSGDQLRVVTILDDNARNYHVQPSPDGRLIAFDSDRDGDRGVYVARRDGLDVRRVSGPGFAAVPTWSPDGRQLAFVRAEKNNARVWNLWLLTLASGVMERLTDYTYGQPWSASWFPDGQRIAYTHEDHLYVEDLSTRHTQSFVTPVAGHLVRTPAVSPDGSRIVFQVYRNGVWLLDLADGSMRCVLQDPTAEEFAWAPDGRRVAFHSRRDGQWGIYVMAKKK